MNKDTKFPTFYKVRFWNGEKTEETQGFIFATTFVDASEQIASYYGDSDIDALEIHMCEENYVLEMEDKDLWWEIFHLCGGKEAFRG